MVRLTPRRPADMAHTIVGTAAPPEWPILVLGVIWIIYQALQGVDTLGRGASRRVNRLLRPRVSRALSREFGVTFRCGSPPSPPAPSSYSPRPAVRRPPTNRPQTPGRPPRRPPRRLPTTGRH